jgi:hypothetical protein
MNRSPAADPPRFAAAARFIVAAPFPAVRRFAAVAERS